MKYRRLGRSGLQVSEISLGSWLTYGKSVPDDLAERTIQRAYELGVNSFDSANVYEQGAGERVLARALRPFPRESYIITTKAFWPMGAGVNERGLSRKHVFEQLHASLKRMELDYVDIFYCHRYDSETPVEETLRAIDDFIRQGKVLYAGVSEWSAAQIQEAVSIADRYLLDRLVVNQPVYNMLNRYIEGEIVPLSTKLGIGLIVFSPLAQGVLTGKYRGGRIPKGTRGSNPEINRWIQEMIASGVMAKVEALENLAWEGGLSLVEMALAWVLRQPNVASALVGATRPEQIESNVKAVQTSLDEAILDKIEAILA